jgi:hypothetical protein
MTFPLFERNPRKHLESLMSGWKRELSKSLVPYREDGRTYPGSEYFCADGFFPWYFSQTPKILFVGRETVQMSGGDYIADCLAAYRQNSIAGVTVNRHAFHSRMMYLAYGILHGCGIAYEDLPRASDIAATFGTREGISFAFMELSKYSNDNEDANSRRDKELMERFLRDSLSAGRNFFREELELLNPDITITMNLWECGVDNTLIEAALGNVAMEDGKTWQPHATVNRIAINGRQVLLIDLNHFSSRKRTKECFYDPVMGIVREKFARICFEKGAVND